MSSATATQDNTSLRWQKCRLDGKRIVYASVGERGEFLLNDRGFVPYKYVAGEGKVYMTRANRFQPLESDHGTEVEASHSTQTPPLGAHTQTPSHWGDFATLCSEKLATLSLETPIKIYTDGGAQPNPGDAGLGLCIIRPTGLSLNYWEYLGKTTNNVAELTAILRALQSIVEKKRDVTIYSDSNYSIGVITGRMKAKKNIALISEIRHEASQFLKLRFRKVAAHSGIHYNELVDQLATRARKSGAGGFE